MSITGSYYHSDHLLYVSEGQIYTLILHRLFVMILYKFIAPGQGQVTAEDKILKLI